MTYSLLRGRAMRATRLNGCGIPVLGPDSVVTSEGFISVGATANNSTGDAITVTNAAGKNCVDDTPTPRFVNYSLEIAFCGVNPELVTMLTGQPIVLSGEGLPVGFRQNSKIDVDLIGFALELWTGVAGDACDDTGETPYGYILFPFVKGGQLGDFSVENAAINFTLTGAVTKDGAGWGVGPYDVTLDDAGSPAPLAEVIDNDHLHLELVTVPPPDVDDDSATELGVAATGATQGSPAVLAPTNSYAPLDLADAATGFTATPGTAWTAGNYVRLRDGSNAHWNGTAWVAGVA
jgi:hypothetical protein